MGPRMAYKKSNLAKQNVLNDLVNTCRVCMKISDSVKDLFHSDSKIVEEIQFCVGILMTKNTNLPSCICLDCLAQLAIAHNFKTTCISSEKTFQALLQDIKVELKCEDLNNISQDSAIVVKEEIDYLYDDDDNDGIFDDLKNVADILIKTSPKKPKETRHRKVGVPKFRKLYCTACELRFKNKQESAEHHQAIHKHEKWVCEICGKQYVHQSSHYAHVQTHGPRRHACPHCDYSTSYKSDLAKHIRVHTDERKYQCHICSSSFRTSSNLHGHIQRNHGGHKKHNCDRCDKKFYTLNRLKRHLDSHNNVKRYECDVCHSCFTRRCHWKMHLQKQHSVSTPPLRPGRRKTSPVLQETPSIFNK